MPQAPPTPLTLARRTLLGYGLILVSYPLGFLLHHSLINHRGLPTLLWSARGPILAMGIPFLTGAAILLRSHRRLTRGIVAGSWTDEQIEAARLWVNSPWLTWTQGAMLIVAPVLSFTTFPGNKSHPGGMMMAYIIINSLTSVRTTLRKPIHSGPPIDWATVKPMHSDHWGQPPASI